MGASSFIHSSQMNDLDQLLFYILIALSFSVLEAINDLVASFFLVLYIWIPHPVVLNSAGEYNEYKLASKTDVKQLCTLAVTQEGWKIQEYFLVLN